MRCWVRSERLIVGVLGTLLMFPGCGDGSTASSDGGSTDLERDGGVEDTTAPDMGADGGDSGETSGTPWFDRSPAPGEGDETIAGYVFSGLAADTSMYQALEEGDSGRHLREEAVELGNDISFVGKSGGWVLFQAGRGERLIFASPWDLANPVHEIEIADEVGESISDAVFHDELDTTFLLADGQPTLFAIEHAESSDSIRTMDLTAESGENPDPEALAVDGQTLLVGLSRLHPEEERTGQDVGEPARVAVIDAKSWSKEGTIDLPHTNVGSGFDRLPNGDFAVGLEGDRETEPDEEGFSGMKTDGGIYRLERASEESYSVGGEILSEEAVGRNLSRFAFTGANAGVVDSFGVTGTVIQRFDTGDGESTVTVYEHDTSMRYDEFCVSPNGSTVGVTTRNRASNTNAHLFLIYEEDQTDQPATHTPAFGENASCLLLGTDGG